MNQTLDLNLTASRMPRLGVNTAKDVISNIVLGQIKKGVLPKDITPIMLWGPPGAGKSELVKQLASIIELDTGKKVHLTDLRLLLFNPVDLRGIPIANEEKNKAKWLVPEILDLDKSDEVINILFLDEISSAPPSVQAAAYQITLDHKIGEHEFPDNTLVIAAGNRKSDSSVSYQMPIPLANRLLHIEIVPDFIEWKNWAIENGINEKIISYISYKTENLSNQSDDKDDIVIASPRTWVKASQIMDNINDRKTQEIALSGLIGIGTASEFFSYIDNVGIIPDINKIFEGDFSDIPDKPDVFYAFITGISTRCREYLKEGKDIKNVFKFGEIIPADYSLILHDNIASLLVNSKSEYLYDEDYLNWTLALTSTI